MMGLTHISDGGDVKRHAEFEAITDVI